MPMPGFSVGHNNISGIIGLDEVDPSCLFRNYSQVEQEWTEYESRELDGDRQYKAIGLPSTKLLFPLCTIEEYKYFKYTLMNGALSVKVTAFLLDADRDEWSWFNGTLCIEENVTSKRKWSEYQDLEIEVKDLVRLA